MLIIFAGLPGVGKSEIARELARQLGAVYLRIDSIEQALRDSGLATGSLDDSGYRIAYALAEDNWTSISTARTPARFATSRQTLRVTGSGLTESATTTRPNRRLPSIAAASKPDPWTFLG